MADPTNPNRQIRGAKLQRAVLDATIRRIETVGIDAVRVADVADMAGVHETSIYRRWKTLPRLLVEALIAKTGTEVPVPDTGSVQTDLEVFMSDLARFSETPAGAALIRGTVVSDPDPEVEAVRREFWDQRLGVVGEVVDRARERGEVPPDTDARLVVLMLGGLVHLHITHIGDTIPADLTQRAVALVMPGLRGDT